MTPELPKSCSCAIDCFPPTTSIINCAEHGMPQNLGDTEYPGTMPKFGLPIHGFGETGYVAPLYDQQQIEEAAQLAKAIGYKVGRPVQICSLTDLKRIAASASPGSPPPSLQYHKPGCIYSTGPHPGDCYVEGRPVETWKPPSPGVAQYEAWGSGSDTTQGGPSDSHS